MDSIGLLERGEPWFDDGNIVLSAETKLFKVYRGVLEANSSVFRDMFDMCSAEGEVIIEDCPVIRLPDQAEYLQHVLKAVSDRGYCSAEDWKARAIPLSAVCAFMDLGRKYDIQRLYSEGRALLTLTFPSTLSSWRQAQRPIENYPGLVFDLITLARQHGFTRVLPAAYFNCLLRPLTAILQGTQRPDGSVALLSPVDQHALLFGREALHGLYYQRCLAWVRDGSHHMGCSAGGLSQPRCLRRKRELLQRRLQPDSLYRRIVLTLVEPAVHERDFCDACVSAASACHAQACAEIWEQLPDVFGLGTWEKVLAESELI